MHFSPRRQFLQAGALAASAFAAGVVRTDTPEDRAASVSGFSREAVVGGRLKQSVVHWCFRPWSVRELAVHSAALGLQSVELAGPEHWAVLKEHGLTCAIAGSHGFSRGFAHTEEQAECATVLTRSMDLAAEAGIPNVITFSGFRRGLSTDEGRKNMIEGLRRLVPHAEKRGVTLCIEMLNSRVAVEMKGHPDYFCDDIELTVDICKEIGSERVKVLFDIYHVQIMHGDVIARIRQYADWIGHVHTAGVPGRGEMDVTQELNYPPILRALADVGYRGYVGHEFIPTREPLAGLREAAQLTVV